MWRDFTRRIKSLTFMEWVLVITITGIDAASFYMFAKP